MRKFIAIMAVAAAGAVGFASCTTSAEKQKQAALEAQVQELKTEMAKKQAIDSMQEMAKLQYIIPQQINVPQAAPITTAAAATPKVVYRTRTVTRRVYVHSAPRRTHRTYARRYYSNGYSGYNQPYYAAQPIRQRRGWSAKAKGAAIGGGAGALAGALLSHQKGKGAIIGGLLGAAGGLGLGAILDHNNGR
jgi:hypothetical protein